MQARLTDEQIREVGGMLCRCLPPRTGWVLVTILPHEPHEHEAGRGCPVQVSGTYDSGEMMSNLLRDAAVICEGDSMRELALEIGLDQ